MREVITQRLWVGHTREARDVRDVLGRGVDVVVDLALEEPPLQYPRDIVYCRFPLVDGEGNTPTVLRAAVDVTERFITAGTQTLIVCGMGLSRSAAIAAMVLARVESIPPDDALTRVTATGPHDVAPDLWHEVKAALGS
ncbi:hypothetical protein Mal4_17300 [Maioricimonas rarisocia]|uniref:Dual specificity phosphatase, catalytic domain n=1 Tax=Maioricimonas rarisocia TaxID=2528026 RepID=A0A517Z4K8_9PLAN|nr:dual specificity protein phosphatase [Maioricimonas rarisocia]QDU37418.1 hypothetical protein Mal4_17300 [Maioricimonas rarisocia]